MDSKILNPRDISFLLYDWLNVEDLTARPRFAEHSRETFDAVLDLAQQIATDHFAPHARKSDLNEPHFDGERVHIIPEIGAALKVFNDAGLMAAGQDEALGGMQLPCVVEKACFAWFTAANIATAAYPFLTIGNANLLQSHGSAALVETYVRPMMTGRFFGTMCLSEPQAGSSLGDITTRAEDQGDGTYRLFGNKMWISGGEHDLAENIVHLVLAKIKGAPPGVKGISLFVVPKVLVNADGSLGARNDVVLAGLNHKMGYRGTTNTLLNFGEGKHQPGGKPGAVGTIVGEPGQGLPIMFHMMNEARIGVGLGGAALGYTGFLHALAYAQERAQGRTAAAKGGGQVSIIHHPDVKRMLLAQKSYAEGALALCLFCARLVDEEKTAETPAARKDAQLLLDILTPIAKAWPSQWGLAANDMAIQIHGGYGYTRDFQVEQIYRDNRLNPIHEGTNGIQALDLLARKVKLDDGARLKLLTTRINNTCGAAKASGDKSIATYGTALEKTLNEVLSVTDGLSATGDAELIAAQASPYLEAFGHTVVAWIWLQQILAIHAKGAAASDAFYAGKKLACRYFFDWELPKAAQNLALIDRHDRLFLAPEEIIAAL
ncbi:MAG: acyl-CoA dehydrogenase [Rhodospirillaceae bacterium]|nr:acyl-CoA dehydrogenase [Rhodospirillaceae bacterium]